jgi:cytochrome c553
MRTLLFIAAALTAGGVLAADPVSGRTKAAACAVCHGPLGISTGPDVPHLAGQPAIYLASQLRNYRSGSRKHEVMNVVAKPLVDRDIDDIAAWFASLQVRVDAP